MRRIVAASFVALLLQCFGCGQFFVLSSVTASQEGQAHVFSTKTAHVCKTTEAGQPVCTEAAKH